MKPIEKKHDKNELRKRREKIVEAVFWVGLTMLVAGVIMFCVGLELYTKRTYDEPSSETSTIFTPIVEVEEPSVESQPIVDEPVEEVPVDTIDISQTYNNEVVYIAKTVYGEARGCTPTEQAAVVWTILNRVDSDLQYIPDDIISVVTQPGQYHGYNPNHPVTDEIASLVEDVIVRWIDEKNGVENVGRVLPKEYLWFYGDGRHNHFTDAWRNGNKWDWSLESPYGGA